MIISYNHTAWGCVLKAFDTVSGNNTKIDNNDKYSLTNVSCIMFHIIVRYLNKDKCSPVE